MIFLKGIFFFFVIESLQFLEKPAETFEIFKALIFFALF